MRTDKPSATGDSPVTALCETVMERFAVLLVGAKPGSAAARARDKIGLERCVEIAVPAMEKRTTELLTPTAATRLRESIEQALPGAGCLTMDIVGAAMEAILQEAGVALPETADGDA